MDDKFKLCKLDHDDEEDDEDGGRMRQDSEQQWKFQGSGSSD